MKGHVVLGEMSSCLTLGCIVVELLGTDGQHFPTGPLIYMWFVFFKRSCVHDPSFDFHSTELTMLTVFRKCWWFN